MAVSKKLRFEVFRRDNFQCRYCGLSAQDGVVLEPDHVVPRSRGGGDVATNLVTACEGCNAGKSDTPISAPPIEDVPQDVFRRACAERGITDDEVIHDEEDEPSSLSREIRMHYDPDEWAQISELERYWSDDDVPASDPEVLTAIEAFGSEHRARLRLESALELLLDMHPAREGLIQCRDTLAADSAEENEERPAWLKRATMRTVFLAEHFLDHLDDEYFSGLPEEEREEWMEYALVWYGTPFNDEKWGLNEAKQMRYASRIAHVVSIGRFYPTMCRGRGRTIDRCPQRAKYRVWMDGCAHCDPDAPTATEGHPHCADHVERLQTAGLINDRFSFRAAEPIAEMV